ncbi:MAG: Crp/Fnr family transcriptional regulator, partial [Pseudomonadota bacterium]
MKINNDNLFEALKERLRMQLSIEGGQFSPLSDLGPVAEIVAARDVIHQPGEHCTDLFVVAQGWLIGSSNVRDGGRYIHRIYQPGDLIGAEDVNWNHGTSTVEAVTPAILGRFPKSTLFSLFGSSPALAAALYGLAMNDLVVAMDAARANARLNAPGRIGHLLLQVKARQDITGPRDTDTVVLPLTQTQIADALGLTNVSVSRGLTELTERGLVERTGNAYRLVKPMELAFLSSFTNRYGVDDHAWSRALSSGLGGKVALPDMPVVL